MAANFMRSTSEADHEGGGDGREGRLERDEGELGDHHAGRERRDVAGRGHVLEEQASQAPDEQVPAAAVREGEAVAPEHPGDDADDGDGRDLHHHRQHVLGADQAAVEQGQARQDHQQDQDGRGEHPGVVALVVLVDDGGGGGLGRSRGGGDGRDGRGRGLGGRGGGGAAVSWAKATAPSRAPARVAASISPASGLKVSFIVGIPFSRRITKRPGRFRRSGCERLPRH